MLLGRDSQGEVKFASQRGIVDVFGKEPFKADVARRIRRRKLPDSCIPVRIGILHFRKFNCRS